MIEGLQPEDLLDNWPAVEARLDSLYADGQHFAFRSLLRDAIASTQDPAGKTAAELEKVAAYHSRITHSSCVCGVCGR